RQVRSVPDMGNVNKPAPTGVNNAASDFPIADRGDAGIGVVAEMKRVGGFVQREEPRKGQTPHADARHRGELAVSRARSQRPVAAVRRDRRMTPREQAESETDREYRDAHGTHTHAPRSAHALKPG